MSVLITGGTGFVGLGIAEALLARGERVLLYGLEPPPPSAKAVLAKLPGKVVAMVGDVRDVANLERLMADAEIDRVIHAAVVTSGPQRERREARNIVDINLMGTLGVLEAAQRRPIRRLVLLSSAGVYGAAGGRRAALSETDPTPDPDSLYAITKFAAERLSRRIATLSGLDVVAARLSAVFGPWERDTGVRDTLSAPYQALVAALEGREAVLPRPGLRDWVYVRDVAGAVLALLDAAKLTHDLYNVSTGFRWTIEDWCQRLARRYPGFRWRLSAEPGEATIDYWSTTDRAMLAIDRITADLGWRPRFDLDAAFTDYMAWLDS
jgi:UDP-glucuronate 4-epimerase